VAGRRLRPRYPGRTINVLSSWSLRMGVCRSLCAAGPVLLRTTSTNMKLRYYVEFGSLTRGLTDMTTMPLYQVSSPLEYLCSNCGKDHASGQFPNCSAKRETDVTLYFYSHNTTNPNSKQQPIQISCG